MRGMEGRKDRITLIPGASGRTEMQIRPATPADLETLVAANADMARETEDIALDLPTLRKGTAAVLAGAAAGAFYRVVENDGVVVAQLMITPEWSDWRNRQVWWVQSVYVQPAWRGRGVYRALYESVRDEARAAGAGGIRLYVDLGNDTAQVAYRRLGMNGDHYRLFEEMFSTP